MGKAFDEDAVRIVPDQSGEVAQETEMGDGAGVKVSKQTQNTTNFAPDWPWSHFQSLRS
jgi:hypothetical protein